MRNHISCVEQRLDAYGRYGETGSIKQATNWRRAFCRALNDAVRKGGPMPCGLPSKGFRYVAIVNLSGERHFLYSDHDTMMRKLCSRHCMMPVVDTDALLGRFSAFADSARAVCADQIDSFVLIVYNLPWQGGLDTSYWEVSTIRLVRGGGEEALRVYDRGLTFTSISDTVFTGRPTLGDNGLEHPACLSFSTGAVEFVDKKCVNDFQRNVVAVCLDFDDVPVATTEPSTAAPADDTARLQSLMAGMTEQRKAMQADFRVEKARGKALVEENASLRQQLDELRKKEGPDAMAAIDRQLAQYEETVQAIRAHNEAANLEVEELKVALEKKRSFLEQSQVENEKLIRAAAKSKKEFTEFKEQSRKTESAKDKVIAPTQPKPQTTGAHGTQQDHGSSVESNKPHRPQGPKESHTP